MTEKFVCEIAVDSAKVSEALVSAVKDDDSPMRFGNVRHSVSGNILKCYNYFGIDKRTDL